MRRKITTTAALTLITSIPLALPLPSTQCCPTSASTNASCPLSVEGRARANDGMEAWLRGERKPGPVDLWHGRVPVIHSAFVLERLGLHGAEAKLAVVSPESGGGATNC